MHDFSLDGRGCWLCPVGGAAELVLLLPCDGETTRLVPGMLPEWEAAVAGGECRPFVLAGFELDSWERDLTPWEAPKLFKRSPPFEGRARETLAWMEGTLLPAVLEKSALAGAGPELEPGILGYSLGGLFALWALCESGRLKSCAACSGSLWYEGWAGYMESHSPPPGSRVYLSLGKNEERAKNPRMAAVGEVTRRAFALYGADPNVAETALEWSEGGHFDGVAGRLTRAILWLAGRRSGE